MSTLVEVNEGEAGTGTETRRRPACGTVFIATYNVRDGREEGEDGQLFLGLCLAAQAMETMGVDVAFLQETKIIDPAFANREFEGYSILVAATDNERQGRIVLFLNERYGFRVEIEKAVGPNIISFELITGDGEGKKSGGTWWGAISPPLTNRGGHSGGYCRLLGSSRRAQSPSSSATLTPTWMSLGRRRRRFWQRRWRVRTSAASAGTLGRGAEGGTMASGHGGNNRGTGGAIGGCDTASRIVFWCATSIAGGLGGR